MAGPGNKGVPYSTAMVQAPTLPLGAFFAMLDSSDEGREILDWMQRSSWELAQLSAV